MLDEATLVFSRLRVTLDGNIKENLREDGLFSCNRQIVLAETTAIETRR